MLHEAAAGKIKEHEVEISTQVGRVDQLTEEKKKEIEEKRDL